MIRIDGSYGEGGGQILRTAVSLSVLTKTPITVTNIRANRRNPGLRPQHHLALTIMKQLSNAETKGLHVGSSEISFIPKDASGGSFEFDIGTAGSMVLVFQTILLGMLKTKEAVSITLHGGSDVKWSPSWDYFTEVFLPVLEQMGMNVSARLIKRGYYPKGGGEAEITIEPIRKDLSSITFDGFQPKRIDGRIHLGNLPDHIAKRMKHEVSKKLVNPNLQCSIRTQQGESLSPGVGITLWTRSQSGAIGAVSLGEKGLPAETVAQHAIDSILSDLEKNATVDEWLSDQILPYIAFSKGKSVFYVRKITDHFTTNVWVLKQFFSHFSCSFTQLSDAVKVSCEIM
jgi:RNA 3'-terminal phosphate cyclase (GTP)